MKSFNTIVSDIFHIEESQINDNLTPKDIPEWDSMSYLLFIAELEKEYKMSFSMNEVIEAQSLGVIRKIVDAKK